MVEQRGRILRVVADAPASRRGRWHLKRFGTIDSTNRWLLDEARAGAADGLVVVADEQTAGRGRRGRTWTAPPGSSLLVSVLIRPRLDIGHAHLLTMAAGLALRAAVEHAAGVNAGLKWPNDLVVNDRKLAGLLAETEISANGELSAVVIGVGCNVEWHDFPSELAEGATACNLEAGRSIERADVLDAFLDDLALRLDDLAAVPDSYRNALATLGRRVRVDLGTRVLEGTATDIDESGQLIVTTDGTTEVVAVGDVVHLRDA
ncbi:MAG: biotin--[acetyl-CoA-carboxylase] ligase [Acidimicrobiia bacterium]|nr:biotin--[acetyl-CoA-carboxylase] ligase [Acidimicrobiia bacterium]